MSDNFAPITNYFDPARKVATKEGWYNMPYGDPYELGNSNLLGSGPAWGPKQMLYKTQSMSKSTKIKLTVTIVVFFLLVLCLIYCVKAQPVTGQGFSYFY